MTDDISYHKAQALAERSREAHEAKAKRLREKAERHYQRKRERACFWTRPWGHVWRRWQKGDPSFMQRECVVCGKQVFNYPDYGGY